MTDAYVLIVDDDRAIVRLCQRLLERASFKVYALTDPLEALKLLETHKVDLLLSDIRMPVMDGFELIERAKAMQPDLAVLVMTGFGTVDTAIQALYRGVDGLILKPFENTADLARAAQRVLDGIRQKQDAARAQVLRPLFDLTASLLAETSMANLEVLVMDAMLNLFGAQHAAVFALDAKNGAGKSTRPLMSRGLPAAEAAGWERLLSFLQSRSADTVVVQVNGSAEADLRDVLRGLGWGGVMAVAAHRNDSAFLFLTAKDGASAAFSASDMELFTILARQTVVAMDNARLYTDLRNSLQRIEESQRALVQAEKMAAVGRLMASLAHEINNPLQAVRNCLHLANRSDVGAQQRTAYLNMTDGELDRLVNTVRHMLDFYRPGLQEKERIQLREPIERVMHLLQAQFDNQNVAVEIHLCENYPPVLGVRDQLQQVFFNLILNAIDAMDGQPEKHIWIEGVTFPASLCIYLEDSGPGIAPEVRERLFEPFTSTKKYGTGLGLSVSYGIVEAHGGQMAVVPARHGQGACFEIRFPLISAE